MRTLLVASFSVAVLASCLPDRAESNANDRRDAGAPDASDVRPQYECDGPLTKSLVAEFLPAEATDYVEWRSEYFNGDQPQRSMLTVRDAHGAPTEIARSILEARRICDAESCPTTQWPWDLQPNGDWRLHCFGSANVGGIPLSGYYAMVLGVARGNATSLLTTRDELVSFFGTIDTKAEAAFIALRDGFSMATCNYGGIEERDEGFAIRVPVPGSCEVAPGGPPHGTEEIVLVVARDGHTRIESRKTLPAGMLGAAE